mmetsp:Transcript_22764/g.40559  ORF Transcript_22764/g.40559 Transcript_22764/m.40559 type:complete len:255 (-) Transcript_22764:475-1239(-)
MGYEYLRRCLRPHDPLALRLPRGLSHNAAYSRVRVQHVRRRVPIQAQHPPVAEFVVRLAVHGEIGVLHGADAHGPGHFLQSFRQLALLLVVAQPRLDILASDAHGLVQQILELDRIPGPRRELLPVLPLHQSERDVFQRRVAGDESCLVGRGEHHLEVLRLPRIRHVQDAIGGLPALLRVELHAMPYGRHVGGGVIEPPVRLAHEHRERRSVPSHVPVQEDDRGALALHGQSLPFQILDDAGEVRVVERFSTFV